MKEPRGGKAAARQRFEESRSLKRKRFINEGKRNLQKHMRYILYAGKSTESEERQILSIEAQLAELQEFAAKEKLEIVASLCEAQTAKEPGRTKFAEMLSFLQAGKADGVLSWHPDRLARNSIDGGQIVYLLDTEKIKDLKFPTFWFENTPQGKFMLNIAFGQSKYYVDNLAEKIKRGHRAKLRKGIWPSLAPLGYVNNHKTRGVDLDSEKAPLIRKGVELYSTGKYTLKQIAKFLKDLGLRSYKGNILSVSCVQRFLQNKFYYGIFKFNSPLSSLKCNAPAVLSPYLRRRLKVQDLPRSRVQPVRDEPEIVGRDGGEVRPLREVLPKESIRVLPGSPLIRRLRVAEEDADVRLLREFLVLGHLLSPIVRQGLAES